MSINLRTIILLLGIILFSVYTRTDLQAQTNWFKRGDVNTDKLVDLSDPIDLLGALFVGGQQPACKDAADSNDDGLLDLSDAIFTLRYLFFGESKPEAPFPSCGFDLTLDLLDCQQYPPCENCPLSLPPIIVSVTPEPSSIINDDSVEISVIAEDSDGEIVKLLIDGEELLPGTNSRVINLQEGLNLIRIEAIDNCGRTAFKDLPLGRAPILHSGESTSSMAVNLTDSAFTKIYPSIANLLEPDSFAATLRGLIDSKLKADPVTADGCGTLKFFACRGASVSEINTSIETTTEGLKITLDMDRLSIRLRGETERCHPIFGWPCYDDVYNMYVRANPKITLNLNDCQISTDVSYNVYDVEFTEMDFFCDVLVDEIFSGRVEDEVTSSFESNIKATLKPFTDSISNLAPIDIGPLVSELECEDSSANETSYSQYLKANWIAKSELEDFPKYPGSEFLPTSKPTSFSTHNDTTFCFSMNSIHQAFLESSKGGLVHLDLPLSEVLSDLPIIPSTVGDLSALIDPRLSFAGLNLNSEVYFSIRLMMPPRLNIRESDEYSGSLPIQLEIQDLELLLSAEETELFGLSVDFTIEGNLDVYDDSLVMTLDASPALSQIGALENPGNNSNFNIRLSREIFDFPDEVIIDFMVGVSEQVTPYLSQAVNNLKLPPIPLPDTSFELVEGSNLDFTIEHASLFPMDTDGEGANWVCAEVDFSLQSNSSIDVILGAGKPDGLGTTPSLSANRSVTLQVFQNSSKQEIEYRMGVPSIFGIEWSEPSSIDHGTQPSVVIDKNNQVLVAYENQNSGLSLKLGAFDPETEKVQFNESISAGEGQNPSISFANNSILFLAYETLFVEDGVERTAVALKIGEINFEENSVSWSYDKVHSAGKQPSVTTYLSDSSNIHCILASQSSNILLSQMGVFSTVSKEANWAPQATYGRGQHPTIAIHLHREDPRLIPYPVLIEAHQGGDSLYSRVAMIEDWHSNEPKIEWLGSPQRFDSGRFPSLASSGDLVLQVHSDSVNENQLKSSSSFFKQRRSWMGNLEGLLELPLWQVTLPGSHDCGTSELQPERAPCGELDDVPDELLPLVPAFAKTQSLQMIEQLYAGIRFFDLRPVFISDDENPDGQFYSYHGAIGATIEKSLKQLHTFMEEVNHELVILELSHFCSDSEEFPHSKLQDLIKQTIGEFLYKGSTETGNLMIKTIGEYVADSPKILLLYSDDYAIEMENQGFWQYPRAGLDRCCGYANTPVFEEMRSDQLNKLENNPGNPDELFNLSWTLTIPTDPIQASATILDLGVSAKELSLRALTKYANPYLGEFIRDHGMDHQINFLFVDFVKDARVTDIAIELNQLRLSQ